MGFYNQLRSPIRFLSVIIIIFSFSAISMVDARPMKFGHYADSEFTLGKTASRFANNVNEFSGGRLKVELYPRSQLGSARTMFDATQQGSLDITLAPAIYLRDIAPKMDILELPFLFKNYNVVDDVFNERNNISQQILGELYRGNLKGLAFWELGFRHISTSRRPIKGPWDLKGLKIRTYSNQALFQTFRLLGATPVSLPFGELFSALKRGSVDGQEGLIDSFFRFKLYQSQRFLSLTRHSYTTLVLVVNLNKFNSLSDSEQKIIIDAAQEAAHFCRSLSRDLENQYINQLRDRGLQIESNPDWEGFRKKIFYEVQDKYVREDGRKLLREIERFLR